jgi:hypothetical protein
MEQPFAIVIAVLVLMVCLAALFNAVAALFPVTVEVSRRAIDDHPGRSFALGVVNVLFLGGVSAALLSIGGSPFRFLGAVVIVVGVIGLTFGLAAVSGLAGERIAPHGSGLGRMILGTFVLGLGGATPYVGWFGLIPYVSCLGLGGFVLGLFRRRSPVT